MIKLRYPNITGKTPEERQNQMERYVRSLVDQLNMQKTTQEPDHKQETVPNTLQTKTDWKSIYPVGAIFLSVSATTPEKLLGGKWEQITDRFLLAAGSSYVAGSTGGEADHTLTVEEMPSHNHIGYLMAQGYRGWPSYTTNGYQVVHNYTGGDCYGPNTTFNAAYLGGVTIESKGNSQSHNNMPPYLAVYIWKRIA